MTAEGDGCDCPLCRGVEVDRQWHFGAITIHSDAYWREMDELVAKFKEAVLARK